MAGELEARVRELVEALDALDVDRIVGLMTDDAQGVDEISRRWMRGRGELEPYIRGMAGAITDVSTEVRDPRESDWGDTGLVTFWMDQDSTYEGARHHVSAPTTIALRREGGDWKVALFHSVPLPEQPQSA